MDISELNIEKVEDFPDLSESKARNPFPAFHTANEICRDPIVLTTDQQTRFLAVLGYKQSCHNNSSNAYIAVWDLTTKKTVVRIETSSNILNIFASPKSKGLFCLSKNRFSYLYPLKESEPTNTANFQKIRKMERETCELHEWTWDPSDPPMTSSEEIHLNASHTLHSMHIIDLLSVKQNDLNQKYTQENNNSNAPGSNTWTCHILNCGTLNDNVLSECAECQMPRPREGRGRASGPHNTANGILQSLEDNDKSIGLLPELVLKTTTLENGNVVHLIGQFVSDLNHSSIMIVNADDGVVLDKVIFNGYSSQSSVITENFESQGNRLLLRKFDCNRATQLDMFQVCTSEIIFFDLETRCEIDSFKAMSLCSKAQSKCGHGKTKNPKESKHPWIQEEKACNYIAKFDVNHSRKQFIIYSQNLGFYQLMKYESDPSISPQTILCGSTYVYELTERTFDNVLLSNGVLFSAPIFESYPRMNKEYLQFRDAATLAVFAIKLYDEPRATKCPIISIMEDKGGLESALMNECSRSTFWDKKDKRDANFAGISKFTQRFLHLVDDYTLTVSIGNASYLNIDFSLSGIEVAEREATQLYKRQIRKEMLEKERAIKDAEMQREAKEKEAKRKLKDKERIELVEKLRKKYVDKDGAEFSLQGKIHTWKKSYGFVRAKGEAKDLGNIFVHITDVKNKKKGNYPNRNKWIQFYAKYDPTQSSLRAVDVMLIDKSSIHDNGSDNLTSPLSRNGTAPSTKPVETHRIQGKTQTRKNQRNGISKNRNPRFKKPKNEGESSSAKSS